MIRRLQQPWEWRAEPCNATCTHRQGSRLARPGGWEGRLFGRIPYDRKNLRGRVALSTGIAPELEPRQPPDSRLSIAYSLTACRLRSKSPEGRAAGKNRGVLVGADEVA